MDVVAQQGARARHERNALLDRIRAFSAHVKEQIAALGSSGTGAHLALDLFVDYCDAVSTEVSDAFDHAPDEANQLTQLQQWSGHFRQRVQFFDDQFRRGPGKLPLPVVDLIENELNGMGITGSRAVLSVGTPSNFMTFTEDLAAALFEGLTNPPMRLTPLAMITVPDLEGSQASWTPIVCGHELAHYMQRQKAVIRSHTNTLDDDAVAQLPDRPTGVSDTAWARRLNQIAAAWLEELTCDAYAVHRFGAAAVIAMTDFLHYVGPVSQAGRTHPPRTLRTRLMLRWLDSTAGGDKLHIADTARLRSDDTPTPPASPLPAWALLLEQHFETHAMAIWADVAAWSARPTYDQATASDSIEDCAAQLLSGRPAVARESGPTRGAAFTEADILNAIWLGFAGDTDVPLNRMALKSLDLLAFLRRWNKAGGGVAPHEPPMNSNTPAGALSAGEIRKRLSAEDRSRLIVTPRLPPAVNDASVDLRLGNNFIVFERSNLGEFDALDDARDPRAIQTPVVREWGDVFFLHPGQLVLAATLEYLVLPDDLAGQVITRSSYGRLGLLSATAVQVHPAFAGCLTLELVNLGELPMAITPGERVAQLMLWQTEAPQSAGAATKKYTYPTGPEFSKIRSDDEADVLRRMRDAFRTR